MSKEYIDQVVSKYNTHAEMGKFVEEAAVGHMVEDILQDRRDRHMSLAKTEVNKDLKQLGDALKQYGVTDLELVDSNHNSKINNGDRLKMTVTEQSSWGFEAHNAKEFSIGSKFKGPFQYADKSATPQAELKLHSHSGGAVSEDGTIPDGFATKSERERASRGEAP